MDCRDGCCGILFYRGVSGEIRGVITFLLGRGIGEMIYMHLGFFFYKRGYVFQLYRLKKSCQVYLFLLSAIAFVCLFYCAEKIYVDKEMLFRIIHLFTAISGIFLS